MAPMTTPATTKPQTSANATKARDETSLVQYLKVWEHKVRKLQRRHPERWCVRGWSDEEVRDALTLHLFEAVQFEAVQGGGNASFSSADVPCGNGDARPDSDDVPRGNDDAQPDSDDWALDLLARRVRELQRGSRLNVTVMDLSDAPLLQREPSHEERYLEQEDDTRHATAAERARESLNQPQRRWLAAMQWTANRGDFFESSDRPNLSAASRVIGKNRSSAARAYKELQARFQEELERLE